MSDIWNDLRHVQHRYHVLHGDSLTFRPAKADRRTHPRYDTPGLRGAIWHSDTEFPVHVTDMSLSGVSVCGRLGNVEEGTEVVLILHLEEDRPLIVACEVVRADGQEYGLSYLALDPVQVYRLFFYMYGLASKHAGLVSDATTERSAA